MSAPAAPPPDGLLVSSVTLTRGARQLFAGLSFEVPPGGVHLLKGPNGAGKTSLLLAIAGVVHPDAGHIRYGAANTDAPLPRHIHLLLPQAGMKPRLTVAENLGFWQAMNGATGIDGEAALVRVGLGGLGPIEAGHLSTGQLRRVALARLLVSIRTLWLLDEPTAALDSEGEVLVAAMLADHCDRGGMAVVATHHDIAAGRPAATTVLGGAV